MESLHDEFSIKDGVAREVGIGGGTRAMILASESEAAFCAGADLKERKGFTKEE